jgi:hypothetical protein
MIIVFILLVVLFSLDNGLCHGNYAFRELIGKSVLCWGVADE